jgi:hypothetical protein
MWNFHVALSALNSADMPRCISRPNIIIQLKPFKAQWFYIYHQLLTSQNFEFYPQDVFRMVLVINSDCFPNNIY